MVVLMPFDVSALPSIRTIIAESGSLQSASDFYYHFHYESAGLEVGVAVSLLTEWLNRELSDLHYQAEYLAEGVEWDLFTEGVIAVAEHEGRDRIVVFRCRPTDDNPQSKQEMTR